MADNDKTKKHIEDSLNKVRAIFEKVAERIDQIKPGEKIPATKLAQDVAEQFDTTGPSIYPTLSMFFFKGYPDIEILRGAHGGLRRVKEGDKNKKVTE